MAAAGESAADGAPDGAGKSGARGVGGARSGAAQPDTSNTIAARHAAQSRMVGFSLLRKITRHVATNVGKKQAARRSWQRCGGGELGHQALRDARQPFGFALMEFVEWGDRLSAVLRRKQPRGTAHMP